MVTWNGVKIADKGFLINLKERDDRLEESIIEFNKNNIVGVERFEAIKITEDSDDGWIIRGCTHSHMEILKLQVENKWDKVIIFEDDFFLDICHKDTNYPLTPIIENIYSSEFDCLFLGATLMEESEFINEYFIKPNKFVQTTVYVSSLNFSKFVTKNFNYLDKFSIVYGEAIDSYYSFLSKKTHSKMNNNNFDRDILIKNNLKIYFSYPIVFNQRESFSNIENKISYYSHYNKLDNIKFYPNNK
jgi:GR25 family glycosyltransferase involved in LPS biosynthesis